MEYQKLWTTNPARPFIVHLLLSFVFFLNLPFNAHGQWELLPAYGLVPSHCKFIDFYDEHTGVAWHETKDTAFFTNDGGLNWTPKLVFSSGTSNQKIMMVGRNRFLAGWEKNVPGLFDPVQYAIKVLNSSSVVEGGSSNFDGYLGELVRKDSVNFLITTTEMLGSGASADNFVVRVWGDVPSTTICTSIPNDTLENECPTQALAVSPTGITYFIKQSKFCRSNPFGVSNPVSLSPCEDYVKQIIPINDSLIWYFSYNKLMRSTNGGLSFQQIIPSTFSGANSMAFTSPDTGFAVVGDLMRTFNGGQSWQLQELPGNPTNLFQIVRAGKRGLVARTFNGKLYRNLNPGDTSINLTSINPTQNYSLTFQLYPNPAQDHVVVQSLEPGVKKVNITDLLGKSVYSSSFEGNETRIGLAGLSSGIYQIEIQTPKGKKARLFVKSK